jgi:hypothetical protein
MYTRPFSIWRKLKPRNFFGMFTPYSSCECGNSFWGPQGEGGGYHTSYHGGRIICYDCYKTYVREITRSNHSINSEPRLRYFGWEYGVCGNPFCFWHYKDHRFEWRSKYKSWTLTDEFYQVNNSPIPMH